MKNKKIIHSGDKISSIIEAGIGKRLFSGIMDGVLFLFLTMLLYMFVFTPIAKAGMNYEGNQVLATQYQVASHLYVYQQANDDNEFKIIEVKDFSEKMDGNRASRVSPIYQIENTINWYLEHTHYYYCSYLTGLNIELPNDTPSKSYDPFLDNFVSPDYDKVVQDTNLYPFEYYTDDWFCREILRIGERDSYFVRDESQIEFIDQINIKPGSNEKDVITFLRNTAYKATSEFYSSPYYSKLNNSIKWAQIFIVGMSVIISYSLFYIAIPLIYKNGETLAKKFNKLAVISANGYKAKKRQIVFRQIILLLELLLSSCVVGIGLTSIATLGVGIFILLICTLISKTHRAPHDYAAYTLLVDAPKSVWFDSPEDETKAAKDLDEKMAKYKNKNIIDKNVIQIGDKIISDEFKDIDSNKD